MEREVPTVIFARRFFCKSWKLWVAQDKEKSDKFIAAFNKVDSLHWYLLGNSPCSDSAALQSLCKAHVRLCQSFKKTIRRFSHYTVEHLNKVAD